jgi:hypothetical protein
VVTSRGDSRGVVVVQSWCSRDDSRGDSRGDNRGSRGESRGDSW